MIQTFLWLSASLALIVLLHISYFSNQLAMILRSWASWKETWLFWTRTRVSRSWRPAGLMGSTTEASREEISLQTVSMCCPQSLDPRLTSWYWYFIIMFSCRGRLCLLLHSVMKPSRSLSLLPSRWLLGSGFGYHDTRPAAGVDPYFPCSCNGDGGEDEALHAGGILLRLLQVNGRTPLLSLHSCRFKYQNAYFFIL